MLSSADRAIRIKRVYDAAAPEDGYRVLVDRLWPRGVRKDALGMDEWAKDLAPSTALRRAWHHGDISDEAFRDRYAAELDAVPALASLARRCRAGTVTLLVATRDIGRSHAHVLARELERQAAARVDGAAGRTG